MQSQRPHTAIAVLMFPPSQSPAWNVTPCFFSPPNAWPLALHFRVKYFHLIRSIFVIKWSIPIFFFGLLTSFLLDSRFWRIAHGVYVRRGPSLDSVDPVTNRPPPLLNSVSQVHSKRHRESRWLKDCGNMFRMDVVAYQCSGPWPFRWWSFKTVYILNLFSSTFDESISYDSSYKGFPL